jgi:hypothetical protein
MAPGVFDWIAEVSVRVVTEMLIEKDLGHSERNTNRVNIKRLLLGFALSFGTFLVKLFMVLKVGYAEHHTDPGSKYG